MTAVIRRGLLWALTFGLTVIGGLLVVACLSLVSGCGSAAQRALSSVAVVAVEADRANSAAYELIADETLERVQGEGGDFGDWCREMVAPWETCSRVECGVEALADLAIAGQAVLDAGDDLDASWFAAACATLAAVDDAWSAVEEPPAVLGTARRIVCGIADGPRPDGLVCHDPGPPPACEEVQ